MLNGKTTVKTRLEKKMQKDIRDINSKKSVFTVEEN